MQNGTIGSPVRICADTYMEAERQFPTACRTMSWARACCIAVSMLLETVSSVSCTKTLGRPLSLSTVYCKDTNSLGACFRHSNNGSLLLGETWVSGWSLEALDAVMVQAQSIDLIRRYLVPLKLIANLQRLYEYFF